ncbi:MAG TPA: DUF2934 domain-containing protein [Povalibacter sp.]|nr:DUF2934 domain-containing protein [Povalibacter sp.]
MSPTPPRSRRPRTKPTDDSTTVISKKPRARKAAAKPAAKDDAIQVIALQPDPAELQGRIATAAYFLAAERNFEPGRELEDWLEAERRVRGPYT